MNLLIVEDNIPVRRMIRFIIAKTCDEIYECSNGIEAVAAYFRHKPDLILMDIKMPELDGIAAARKICSVNPKAKIIMVTNYDDPLLRAAAIEAGASSFILKDDLSQICSVIMEQKQH